MLDVISSIICSLFMPLCFSIYFKNKSNLAKRLLVFGGCALVMFIFTFVYVSELILPLIFILMSVLLVLIGGVNIKELWIVIASYTQCALINVTVDYVLVQALKLSGIELALSWRQFIVALLSAVFIVLSSLLIRYVSLKLSDSDSKYIREVVAIVVCNILLLAILVMVNNWVARINNWNSTIESVNIILFCTYTLVMIIVMILVIRTFKEKDRMEQEKQQYDNLLEYSSQIENMYTDLRSFKHDYVNIMSTMSGFFESKDYEGLEEYFNQNIVPTGKKMSTDNYRLNQLKNIQNVAIKGLISSKLIYAHEMGIDTYIDIVESIEDFGINDVDLGRMMGILLDNAIEATKECDNREIRFNIAKTDSNVCIVIANTYNTQKPISLSQISKKGFSTKGQNRGMGLYNVDMILAKYKNIFKQTKVDNGFFIQKIEVDVKSSNL